MYIGPKVSCLSKNNIFQNNLRCAVPTGIHYSARSWCVTLEMFISVYLSTSQRYQKLLGSGLVGNQSNEFLWTNIYEDFWVTICSRLVPECTCYLSQSPRPRNNNVGMLLSHFSALVVS